MVLLLVGCASTTTTHNIEPGMYVAKDIRKGRIWVDPTHYPFLESIIYLSPDSTFAINTDICSGYGKWYMENDSLVLSKMPVTINAMDAVIFF